MAQVAIIRKRAVALVTLERALMAQIYKRLVSQPKRLHSFRVSVPNQPREVPDKHWQRQEKKKTKKKKKKTHSSRDSHNIDSCRGGYAPCSAGQSFLSVSTSGHAGRCKIRHCRICRQDATDCRVSCQTSSYGLPGIGRQQGPLGEAAGPVSLLLCCSRHIALSWVSWR